ncbi:DapH/DapD/GlmU-related protein [Frigoribacterium sp. UYMn621]|uniref:acyltransferase n=1 Tax=Frigoribacterium sp. UYMn621 TaxID=3156343 RepID=UPI003396C27D
MLAFVWILPAGHTKNHLLRRLGHFIHPSAIARSNIVLKVSRITMGPGSRIGKWNVIKDLRLVSIGASASIGRLNVISSHPVYKRLYPDGASLSVKSNAFITSRHQLDCSGSITLGSFSTIAGHETKILSHSIDVREDVQVAHPIIIGDRSFVGARCLILGGAFLPERSVLAAGSVLARSKSAGEPGLYAGVPARFRGPVEGKWFGRTATGTSRVFIPATGKTVEDAL